MKRNTIIAIMITFCFTATLFMILPIRSAINPYNPWLDYDENGGVGLTDLVNLANSYGTTGDPTKNVNVMNWPVATQITVFYQQTTGASSALYNASGFGHIHMLWDVLGLAGSENVTIRVYSNIYDPEGSGYYTTYLSPMVVTSDNIEGSTSFPVPGEVFGFQMSLAVGTTATVNLAYYLTYA